MRRMEERSTFVLVARNRGSQLQGPQILAFHRSTTPIAQKTNCMKPEVTTITTNETVAGLTPRTPGMQLRQPNCGGVRAIYILYHGTDGRSRHQRLISTTTRDALITTGLSPRADEDG